MKRNDTPQDVWEKLKADADANAFSAVTTEGGKDLSRFIRESIALKKDLQKAEAAAKAVRVERDRLLYDLIPALMTEMGIERVEVDGHTVALYSFGSGTMPKDPAENAAALAHLREIGAGEGGPCRKACLPARHDRGDEAIARAVARLGELVTAG